jgi:TolA-binding protein
MPKLLTPLHSPRLAASILGVVLIVGTTAVVAQVTPMEPVQWDKRRLDQLDRNVRRLERAVTQRNAAGQPVLVEPDPETIALQGRVDIMDRRLRDLESTVQRVNGDLERLTFQLDERQRDTETLTRRLRETDGRVQTLVAAAERAVAEREAEVEANASPTGSAAGDLALARTLVATDREGGVAALERLIANWPEAVEAREAEWRVGDALRTGGDQAGAVGAYARALRGWPTAAWAGEVTIKLARGLTATRRQADACSALGEFERRYAARASADLRAVATRARTEANCA